MEWRESNLEHGRLQTGAEFWAASAPSRDHVGLRRKQGQLPLSQTQSNGGEGQKHVTVIRKGMKAFELPQSYNFIFACNGAGSMMPILVGFRSNKVQAGKMQIFPLKKYSSLFAAMLVRDLQQGRHQAAAQTVREQNSQPDARGVQTAGRTQRRRVFHCL